MFKLTLSFLSVTDEDLNLQQRYRYEDINILVTCYFVFLSVNLGAVLISGPNFSCPVQPFPCVTYRIRMHLVFQINIFHNYYGCKNKES